MSLSGQEEPRVVRDCASRSQHPFYGNAISRRWNSFDDETNKTGEDLSTLELPLIIKMDVLSYRWKEGVYCPIVNILIWTL